MTAVIIDLEHVLELAAGAGLSPRQAARILDDMQRFVVAPSPGVETAPEKPPASTVVPIRGDTTA